MLAVINGESRGRSGEGKAVMTHPISLGPSILTADFLNLGQQIKAIESAGVDYVHLDIMDGRFVPNISFGMPIVNAVNEATSLPLDVHLMIEAPEDLVGAFVEAGADTVTVQVEAAVHTHRLITTIREMGAQAGIALCPGTPVAAIEELVPFVDQILVMSVNPGFGGQSFIPTMLDKIRRIRALIDERRPMCRLQVDGGIKPGNIGRAVEAGAESFVVGSSVFDGTANITANVRRLREAAADSGV
jgi:ribulose-phosphate 3-epimerase